jgi:hypothetical protein
VTAFKVSDTKSPPLASQVPTWSPLLDVDAVTVPRLPAVTAAASPAPAPAHVSASAPASSAGVGSSSPRPESGGQGGGGGQWQRRVIENVIGVLYEYRVELAAAFSMFDTDRSGRISSKEFRVGLQALTSLTGGPLTDMQADELMKVLDTNGDGEIDFHEFVGAFKLVDIAAGSADAPAAASRAGGRGGAGSPQPPASPSPHASSSHHTALPLLSPNINPATGKF